jgi:hypothetical protein
MSGKICKNDEKAVYCNIVACKTNTIMLKSKFLLPLTIICLAFFTACDKDDDDHDNEVTITFISPTNGEVVADAADVTISIKLTATEENEDTDIVLYPETNPEQKILDVEIHEHKKVIDFTQKVDLSAYPSGTNFVLAVTACLDHDCDETSDALITFSIP